MSSSPTTKSGSPNPNASDSDHVRFSFAETEDTDDSTINRASELREQNSYGDSMAVAGGGASGGASQFTSYNPSLTSMGVSELRRLQQQHHADPAAAQQSSAISFVDVPDPYEGTRSAPRVEATEAQEVASAGHYSSRAVQVHSQTVHLLEPQPHINITFWLRNPHALSQSCTLTAVIDPSSTLPAAYFRSGTDEEQQAAISRTTVLSAQTKCVPLAVQVDVSSCGAVGARGAVRVLVSQGAHLLEVLEAVIIAGPPPLELLEGKQQTTPQNLAHQDQAEPAVATAAAAAAGSAAAPPVGPSEVLRCRRMFIDDLGAVVSASLDGCGVPSSSSPAAEKQQLFVLTHPRNDDDRCLQVAYFSSGGSEKGAAETQQQESLFVADLTIEELAKLRDEQRITYCWAAFFKSMASDTLKGKVKCAAVGGDSGSVAIGFHIRTVKSPNELIFKLRLRKVAASSENKHKYLLEPMTRAVQKRRSNPEVREQERRTSRLMTELRLNQLRILQHRATIDRARGPTLESLRAEATAQSLTAVEASRQIGSTERRIKILESGQARNELDDMYERGGARCFQHLPQVAAHVPDPNPALTAGATAVANFLQSAMPSVGTCGSIKAISDPNLRALYSRCDEAEISGVLNCMAKLDQWDYNVFDCEAATGGNALFYTTYAVLAKMGLLEQLKLDDAVLRRLLLHVQAGYHPLSYHNATHAADVTQINYFILTKAGLAQKLRLSAPELFAAIFGAAMHDYDHPGVNNSFHIRTNAYLSTLYNDRSVLENHHLACVFEMMQRPEFNLLKNVPADDKRDIRDTMCEMVLSTDMAQHGRVFGAFRRRVSETPAWHERQEDKRLALSMCLKMADTSNCGRPNHLYLRWAKGLAQEFYAQGNLESGLALPISPYMDRRMSAEFPKGQIFFMNVVVLGMYEKMAELLPELDVAVRFCGENKEFWMNNDVSALGL